jgi:acyl-CoA reductase-like NAD-dependent aldehyde dehydrogenase
MQNNFRDSFADGTQGDLAPYWSELSYAENQLVFKEGETADTFAIVVSGKVRIELEQGELDSDSVLARLGPGDWIGELALLDGGPRSASVIADSPLTLRLLSADALKQMEQHHPAAAIAIYRALGASAAGKLRLANDRLANAIFEAKDPEVETRVAAAREVLPILLAASEDSINKLLDKLADHFFHHAKELAELTVATTGLGNVPHKIEKNHFASRGVLSSIRGNPGFGILGPEHHGTLEIASPAGVVFGLIPVTNPVATAIFKALVCLKSRNAPILSFPRRAAEIGTRVDEMFRAILTETGWPASTIQTVTHQNSRRRTEAFFRHPGVDLILATGGSSMVKAAYRSGKPAYGVGAGNAPCFIADDADPATAAAMIVLSKSFDNGLICGSEHNLVVHQSQLAPLTKTLESSGAAVLTPSEASAFHSSILTEDGSSIRRKHIGQSAASIAAAASITRDHPIRLIVIPASNNLIGKPHALSNEKMAPVLSLFTTPTNDEAIAACKSLLENDGRGHTAVIHTAGPLLARRFALEMPASRILHNTPATHGVIGITPARTPSLTLGCGFFGGNSTTDNVTYSHLRNVKRLASHLTPSN